MHVRLLPRRAKRFLMILAIVPTMTLAAGPEETLFKTDAADAWRVAQQQNCPILVFVTTDACVHCRKMTQQTFKDEQVISDIQRNFVATVVKPSDGLPLVDRLGIRSYPTTAVIAPNGEVLTQIKGYVSPADFRLSLERSLQGIRVAFRP